MTAQTPLQEAAGALRAVQAEHSAALGTQERVLRTLETMARRKRWTRRSIASVGLCLFIATGSQAAFVGVDETRRRLASLIGVQTTSRAAKKAAPMLHAPAASVTAGKLESASASPAVLVPAAPLPPAHESQPQSAPALSIRTARRASVPTPRPESRTPPVEVSSVESTPTPTVEELYAEAHQLHFVLGNKFAALDAWDRYLAAKPSGGLAPEARYNRGLCLIALGRTQQAVQALSPIAKGADGGYRQKEAARLLRALSSNR